MFAPLHSVLPFQPLFLNLFSLSLLFHISPLERPCRTDVLPLPLPPVCISFNLGAPIDPVPSIPPSVPRHSSRVAPLFPLYPGEKRGWVARSLDLNLVRHSLGSGGVSDPPVHNATRTASLQETTPLFERTANPLDICHSFSSDSPCRQHLRFGSPYQLAARFFNTLAGFVNRPRLSYIPPRHPSRSPSFEPYAN